MDQKLRKQRTFAFGAVAGVTSAIVMMWSVSTTNLRVATDRPPSPFDDAEMTSVLQGSVTRIGVKSGYPVDAITYEAGEVSEGLAVDVIYFVLTPSSGISSNAPLKAAITQGKRVFGYKYTQGAATEIAMRNVQGATFAQRFPGQFFTSEEQRADDTYIMDFEAANGVTFLPLSSVTLTTNARYLVIANDAGTSFQVKNLMWCSNGIIEGTESCDDGNLANNDGCSNVCAIEAGYSCSGQPSMCSQDAVCGNGILETGEECDDGNRVNDDFCDNSCRLLSMPL